MGYRPIVVAMPYVPDGVKPLLSIPMTQEESDVLESIRSVSRRVVILGFFAGLGVTDLARTTGMSEKNLQSVLCRWRQDLGITVEDLKRDEEAEVDST